MALNSHHLLQPSVLKGFSFSFRTQHGHLNAIIPEEPLHCSVSFPVLFIVELVYVLSAQLNVKLIEISGYIVYLLS